MKHFPQPILSIGDILKRMNRRADRAASPKLAFWQHIVRTADEIARDMARRDGWEPKADTPFYLMKEAKARKCWKKAAGAMKTLFGVDLDQVVVSMRVEERAIEIERRKASQTLGAAVPGRTIEATYSSGVSPAS